MPITLSDPVDDRAEMLFRQLHECMGYNAQALKAQALFLNQNKKNRDFMKMASAEMGRNARHWARAVDYFRPYFDQDHPELTADNYLQLFAYASLKHEDAVVAFAKKQFTLPLWLTRQYVEECKAGAKGNKDKAPSLAERCAELVNKWRKETDRLRAEYGDVASEVCIADGLTCATSELAELPEVAKALERK